jgi:hypothetical protein
MIEMVVSLLRPTIRTIGIKSSTGAVFRKKLLAANEKKRAMATSAKKKAAASAVRKKVMASVASTSDSYTQILSSNCKKLPSSKLDILA